MRFLNVAEFRKAVSAFQSGTSLIVDGGPPRLSLSPANMSGEIGEMIERVKAFSGTPEAAEVRNRSRKKDRMLENRFRQDLLDLLRESFHEETFKKMKLLLHTSSNPLVEIVGKLSIAYDTKARRYLKTEAEELKEPVETPPSVKELAERSLEPGLGDPTEQVDAEFEELLAFLDLDEDSADDASEAFDLLAKISHLDVVLQKVEKLCRAHACVWVRPLVTYDLDEKGEEAKVSGRLSYVVYTPSTAGVIPDYENATEAAGFYYFGEEARGGKVVTVIHLFTPTAYVKLDNEFKPISEVKVNELGRLPVSKFELDIPINGYFCAGVGDDLFEATLEVCVLKTIQNQRAKDTAFKQFAIQGDPAKFPADQIMGGSQPIILGDDATAEVLDLQPNLEQWTSLVREREKGIQTKYGITVDSESQGQPESGYAKKLRMAAVLRENRRVRPHLLRCEEDLFDLIGRSLELRPIPDVDGVPAGELVIDFAEPSIDENPKDQLEIDSKAISLNLTNAVEILRRENPDLSSAELARLAWNNMKINDLLSGARAERVIDFLSLGGKTQDGNAQGTNAGGSGPGAKPGTQAAGNGDPRSPVGGGGDRGSGGPPRG